MTFSKNRLKKGKKFILIIILYNIWAILIYFILVYIKFVNIAVIYIVNHTISLSVKYFY